MTRHTTLTRRHAGAAARAAVSSARSTPRRQAGQDPRRPSHGAAQRRWSRWPQGSAATFDESASRQTGHASLPGAAAGSVSTTRAAAGHAATASDEIGAVGSVGGGAAAAAAAKYRSLAGSHVSPGSAPSGPVAASPRPMRPLGGVRLRLAIRTARRRRAQRHRLQVYATVRTALIWRLSTHASKRSYACEYVLRLQRGCYDCFAFSR